MWCESEVSGEEHNCCQCEADNCVVNGNGLTTELSSVCVASSHSTMYTADVGNRVARFEIENYLFWLEIEHLYTAEQYTLRTGWFDCNLNMDFVCVIEV